MTRILVVEDDVDICNLIRTNLEGEGYSVRQAFDGPAALVAVAEERIDLVILDWMLPGLDGLTVCRRIRQSHLMPIIMLTARGEEIDRVVGLEVGADDYVTKPFGMRELMARVRAILRRAVTMSAPVNAPGAAQVRASASDPSVVPPGVTASDGGAAVITHGELVIDPSGRTVLVEGKAVDLTRREFDLLAMLASNPGRAFSRAYLLERIWGDEIEVFDRTVDSHVVRLRKKLGPAGQRIATVWGVGYRFAS
ncbi:MAG TPA: response regulator transcription factor [Thermomicrobiales bacterium]|jgi:DNA-binding response OmpR family regulator|nr:response regulator transcription factor [Thermomicrobiales bacterium]